jgi:hypothetical protein
MIDVEPLIRTELDRLVPPPASDRANWNDVRRRARPIGRRPLVLAFAAAFAVLASAAALAAGLGGFDAWLRGAPGKPASMKAQERFRASNGRSWAAFPTTTELRELIRTRTGGHEYVLYGFRSGNSLCLKLATSSEDFQPQSCAPASVLMTISAPVLVVMGNFTFFDRASRPTALTSFGIAADGVSRVDAHAIDGTHRALVGGNAYLFVQAQPSSAARVTRISAVGPSGRRTRVSVAEFGPGRASSGSDVAPGPTKIDVRIDDPRIGWYERGERRGVSADAINLPKRERSWLRGARLVKPDPFSNFVVGLSGHYCLVTLNGMGCGPKLFPRGPLAVGTSGGYGLEFAWVHGAAADGVARVVIFLADGQRIRAPLKRNLFAALVPATKFPMRVVGYDRGGHVVAIETGLNFFRGPRVPPGAKKLEPIRSVRGPNGSTARLLVGRRVGGFKCWSVEFGGGKPVGGCMDKRATAYLRVAAVRPAGEDLFVVGEANPAVRRVELRFSNRDTVVTRPFRGVFVLAVPRDHLSRVRRRAFVVTFDADGHRRGRQRIFFRLS